MKQMYATPVAGLSPQLLNFAKRHARLVALNEPLTEQRSEPRQVFTSPALLQALDQTLNPLGDPFAAVTRDLSLNGVGLIVEDLPKHELYAVQFTIAGHESCLLVKQAWNKPMGPYEYVGFRVLKLFDSLPEPGWSNYPAAL